MHKIPTVNQGTIVSKTVSDKKKKLKQGGILMAVLPLAACGGGGGSAPSGGGAPVPPPAPDPTFTESPTNVFVAVDDTNSTLSEGAISANLTVTGKAGADSITTGSGADTIDGAAGNDTIVSNAGNDAVSGGTGNDIINTGSGADHVRGGEGQDSINAGDGNDAIVVVGTTTAGQYTNADITNSAGSGTNLSDIITLADLNGRTVSEVVSGEIINGGSGVNTLFIYGTVDLTGVTLQNVTVLVVNSDVTLSADQIAQFTTIDGDGTSTINIEVPPGDTYVIDLSTLNLTEIGNLNVEGDVTFVVDDATDFAEIGAISTEGSADVKVEINGNGGATTVNLGDIASKFDSNVDTLEIAPDVTLEIDDAGDIADLGIDEIAGGGDIDTGGNSDIEDALDNVSIAPMANSDVGTTDENSPVTIDVLANDADANEDTLSIDTASITSGSGSVSIVANELVYDPNGTYAHLNDGDSAEISIEYQISDGNGGTDTASVTVTVNGANNVINGTEDNNILSGSAGIDIIDGLGGDDTIDGKGGVDIVNGGAGDDIIIINQAKNSENAGTIDGGDGDDTIQINGSSADTPFVVDLSTFNATNIENISLSEDFVETLTITPNHVVAIAPNTNQGDPDFGEHYLRINGQETDTVNIDASWQFTRYFLSDGQIYQQYTVNADNYIAHVEVSMNIGTISGPEVPPPSFTETTAHNWTANDLSNSALNITESTADLTVTGNAGNNYIATGDGDDVFISGGGRNFIATGAGNDQVIGGDGYDSMRGSEGNDIFDGGAGSDYLSYFDSTGAVTINFAEGIVTGGHATGDTITNVEQIAGSIYNDTLTGDDKDNLFTGGFGDDVINGGAGHDVLYGNQGTDIVNGGDGDDLLSSNALNNDVDDTFDGGDGFDAFRMTPDHDSNSQFSFVVSSYDIFNVEMLKIWNTELVIEAQDILDITDLDNTLYIDAAGFLDEISITSSSAWTHVDNVVLNGELYFQYTNNQTDLATLNIHSEISLGDDFTAPISTFEVTNSGDYEAIDDNDSTLFGIDIYSSSTITGKGGDDIIITQNGSSTINGGAGDDILGAGTGVDILNGGDGNDTFIAVEGENSETEDTFNGGNGDRDTLLLNGVNNGTGTNVFNGVIESGPFVVDMETINATDIEFIEIRGQIDLTIDAAEVVGATDDNNTLYLIATPDNAVLTLNTNDDWTFQHDTVRDGVTFHLFTSGDATLAISSDFPALPDFDVPAAVYTENPDDTFTTDATIDTTFDISSRDENLTITGGTAADTITSGIGYDVINGGVGNDIINSGDGGDTVTIDAGNDTVNTGFGNDRIIVGSNADLASQVIDGGAEADTLDLSALSSVDVADINANNIEKIDFRGGTGTNVTMETADFDAVNGDFTGIYIMGDSNDTFTTTSDWTYSSSSVSIVDGEHYHSFFVTDAGTFTFISISAEFGAINGLTIPADPTYIIVSPNVYKDTGESTSIFADKYSSDDITYTGTGSSNNRILTGSGNDTIDIQYGGATIISGAGDDTITWTSDAANLSLDAGAGADEINGEFLDFGTTHLYYLSSTAAVTVDLANGVGSGGNAQGDTISGINFVTGSIYGDTLIGDENNNIFDGDEGQDILNGAGGDDEFHLFQADAPLNDIIDGGDGFDSVKFSRNQARDDFEINLAELNAVNIEELNLHLSSSGSANSANFTFTVEDVIKVTDANNELYIIGDASDTVTTTGWSYSGVTTNNNFIFYEYQNNGTTVFLHSEIQNVTGLTLPDSNFTKTGNDWVANSDTTSVVSLFGSEGTYDNVQLLTITGKGGDDYIATGRNEYIVDAAGGNDTVIIRGSTGTFDGGDGMDWIMVNGFNQNYTVSLSNDSSSSATILNFENIQGSLRNDYLTGDDGVNIINGGYANDEITGLDGGDTLDGGQGVDTLGYTASDAGVTVNIETNAASGGHADGDIISNFENVYGSEFDDLLTGNTSNNKLFGQSGADTIIGAAGNDYLEGGAGKDTLDGGSGDDILVVEQYSIDNTETFEGGADTDTLQFLSNGTPGGTADFNIDLSDVQAFNIEIIELDSSDFGAVNTENLTLTAQDVLDVTDVDNELRIDGILGDTVTTTDQINWTQGDDQDIGGETYNVYNSGSGATLLIDNDITQDIT